MDEPSGLRESALFSVEVENADGDGRAVVVVAGDVDLHSGPELRERLAEIVDGEPRQVVVDLTETTFLDSMALGVLLGAKKRLASNGGQIAIVVSNADLRRIFELTMLDRVFDLYPSREALAAADGAG